MVSGEQKNIRVSVRVRPFNRRELEQNQRTIIKVIDQNAILFDPDDDEEEFFFQGVKQNHRDITKRLNKKLTMEFDRVFDADSTNLDVFEECTKPLVDSVMNGYNCSVFVYGATGAGKTFTMLGNDDFPGITFLTMQELFNKINILSETRKFDIGISYLEVYNEQVMNLLKSESRPLKLLEDCNGVIVSGLVLKPIHNADELLNLLAQGNKNRTQHPTDANSESSRSHAIFQVHIRMIEKKTGQKRTVKLSMIDLAGSERAASTKGIGARFKEGASINKSLLALGNCINKLADGLKHIPYRDSHLTRILKDSLGGNCQTVMIANVSPSSLTYEDTYNTLKYASRAKKIRTTIRQNILKANMPKEFYVNKVNELMNERDRLKEFTKQLETKLSASKPEGPSLIAIESDLTPWYQKIDDVVHEIIKFQEKYLEYDSNIKQLTTKINLLQSSLDSVNKLPIDGIKNEHAQRTDATIAVLQKDLDVNKKEQKSILTVLAKSQMNFIKLRQEIQESKNSFILDRYAEAKNLEVSLSREHYKWDHIVKIKDLFFEYSLNLSRTLHIGCDIINKLLSQNNNFIDSYKENLNEMMQCITKQSNISYTRKHSKFEDNEDELDIPSSLTDENIHLIEENARDVKRKNHSDTIEEVIKRYKTFNPSEGNVFKRPMVPAVLSIPCSSLNETHVINANDERATNGDINSTFRVPDSTVDNKKKDKEIFKSILTEQNVNASNTAIINKALIKSNITHRNLLNKVTVGINKENKNYSPSRIRKSPRSLMKNKTTKALDSAANLYLGRQRTKSRTPRKGEVRINRAASMRAKINK